MNIFETAARKKLRFSSNKGDLTVEQLFDLPLVDNRSKTDLDTVARAIAAELRELNDDSFVAVQTNSKKGVLELKLDIVKHVIKTKQDEIAKRTDEAEKATKRAQLSEIISRKKNEALEGQSIEALEAELASLG